MVHQMSVEMKIVIDAVRIRIYFSGHAMDMTEISHVLSSLRYVVNIGEAIKDYRSKKIKEDLDLQSLRCQANVQMALMHGLDSHDHVRSLLDDFTANREMQRSVLDSHNKKKYRYEPRLHTLLWDLEREKSIKIEFYFNIAKCWSDGDLAAAVNTLLRTSMMPSDPPNMRIADLRLREYAEIFPKTQIAMETARAVIQEFDKMSQSIMNSVYVPLLLRDVSPNFTHCEELHPPVHLPGLKIFAANGNQSEKCSTGTAPAKKSP